MSRLLPKVVLVGDPLGIGHPGLEIACYGVHTPWPFFIPHPHSPAPGKGPALSTLRGSRVHWAAGRTRGVLPVLPALPGRWGLGVGWGQ